MEEGGGGGGGGGSGGERWGGGGSSVGGGGRGGFGDRGGDMGGVLFRELIDETQSLTAPPATDADDATADRMWEYIDIAKSAENDSSGYSRSFGGGGGSRGGGYGGGADRGEGGGCVGGGGGTASEKSLTSKISDACLALNANNHCTRVATTG